MHGFARGGRQGCPDLPAAFAEVIAMTDFEAEAAMRDVRWTMSTVARCSTPTVQGAHRAGSPARP